MDDKAGLAIAFEEAKQSYQEGGVPIGAALISRDGKLLGRGHNMRVQLGSAIHHVRPALFGCLLNERWLLMSVGRNVSFVQFWKTAGFCL
jgi:hypothetical protein